VHRLPHLLVTCKNVWTSREGVEYAWFNNVETKPGIGYPKEWENQDKWNGGWVRTRGKLVPRAGGRWRMLAKIFANPTCRRSTTTTSRSPSTTSTCTPPEASTSPPRGRAR
jgi:nitrate reductase beta subunit